MIVVTLTACGGGTSAPMPDAKMPGPDAALLPGPTLTARPGQSATHLSWTAVGGATSYQLYRASAKGTQGSAITTVTSTSYDDTSITNFQPEYYEVTGVVGGSETAPSNQAEAFGYDLSHWTTRREAYRLLAFAYAPASETASGAPIYVSAGEGGTVVTSSDGTAWTSAPKLPIERIDSVAFGAGLFVAGGYSQGGVTHNLFTSTDAVHWTVLDSGLSSDLNDAAYAYSGMPGALTNVYVVVSASGKILSSHDGTTWTPHTCGTNELYSVSALQYTDATGAAAFEMMAAGFQTACVSTDGVNWSPVTLSGPAAMSTFVSLAADPAASAFWLLDYQGLLFKRPYNTTTHAFGAATSTTLTIPAGQFASVAAYVDGAMTHHVVVTTTLSGLLATTAMTPTGFAPLTMPTTFLAPDPTYQALGVAGTSLFVTTWGEQILRSDDGTATFTIARDDPGGNNVSVASRDGLSVVAQDQNGSIWTSSDSASFAFGATGAATYAYPIALTPTGFSVVYPDYTIKGLDIYESSDAQTWTLTPAPFTQCTGCTIYAGRVIAKPEGGYLISVDLDMGTTSAEYAVTGSAAAGFTTTPQNPPSGFMQTWEENHLFYGLTNIYSTMTFCSILESGDGITWNTVAQFPPTFYADWYLDDGATKYVVDAFGKMSSSTDGVTWSAPVTLDPGGRTINKLIRLGDHLIAVGNNGVVMASLDGVHWDPVAPEVGQDSFYDVAITDRGLVLVGANDVVVTMP
jgi:hypothetical protein